MVCNPEHPKWDQNPRFTPLSETTSIPALSYAESRPRVLTLVPLLLKRWIALSTGYIIVQGGTNREEKSLRQVAMVAKFLDDNKPIKSLKILFALLQT